MSMFPCGNGTSATRSRLDQMIDFAPVLSGSVRGPRAGFGGSPKRTFLPSSRTKAAKDTANLSSCLPLCPLCPKIVVAIRDLIKCQCITLGKSLLQGRCLQQNGADPFHCVESSVDVAFSSLIRRQRRA